MSVVCRQPCWGGGNIYVKFLRYVNARGTLRNGHCCDGRYGICVGNCDHYFKICFDAYTG